MFSFNYISSRLKDTSFTEHESDALCGAGQDNNGPEGLDRELHVNGPGCPVTGCPCL